jgi:hypothetical protein
MAPCLAVVVEWWIPYWHLSRLAGLDEAQDFIRRDETALVRGSDKTEVNMRTLKLQRFTSVGALLMALVIATSVQAQVEVGTWLRQSEEAGRPAMTMTVERCCGSGRRIVYRIEGMSTVMTVESRFDGSEAPVLVDGKPSGETMAIKRLDDRHTSTVLKMNGKEFGTSKAALSPDGKMITVENDFAATGGGHKAGKHTEVWVRK